MVELEQIHIRGSWEVIRQLIPSHPRPTQRIEEAREREREKRSRTIEGPRKQDLNVLNNRSLDASPGRCCIILHKFSEGHSWAQLIPLAKAHSYPDMTPLWRGNVLRGCSFHEEANWLGSTLWFTSRNVCVQTGRRVWFTFGGNECMVEKASLQSSYCIFKMGQSFPLLGLFIYTIWVYVGRIFWESRENACWSTGPAKLS